MKSFEALLFWYQDNRRSFPWRRDREFYHVYLSEIMLQQTRAVAVIGYYNRFLEKYPDMESFAKAKEEDYLKLWEGLGYYSRVRNLHDSVSEIVRMDHLPDTRKELLALKGVGDYTASILLAICFHKDEIAVDGNLFRVFSRLTCYPKDILSKGAKEDCRDYFKKRLCFDSGDFNQALMDLGETVCLPHGSPLCGGCPLRSFCRAYQRNEMEKYPVKKPKKEKRIEKKTVLLISYGDSYLIEKREAGGLLASLYQYVMLDGDYSGGEVVSYLERNGLMVDSADPLPSSRHVFSHLVWEMRGYHVSLHEKKALGNAFFVTYDEIKRKYALPSAFERYTEFISSRI